MQRGGPCLVVRNYPCQWPLFPQDSRSAVKSFPGLGVPPAPVDEARRHITQQARQMQFMHMDVEQAGGQRVALEMSPRCRGRSGTGTDYESLALTIERNQNDQHLPPSLASHCTDIFKTIPPTLIALLSIILISFSPPNGCFMEKLVLSP